MPASTTNYSWNLPTVGGDEDAWGGFLNTNWTNLDTLLGGVSQAEFGYVDGVTSPIQTQFSAGISTGKAIAMAMVFG